MKKGERVWMFGMGSGLKCISVVVECIRFIIGEFKKGLWVDCVGRYLFLVCNNN